MPRHESDKEDLIADAVALVDRVEYSVPRDQALQPCLVTAGFRSDRSLSIYFDQDPYYQFDSAGYLRRSFADGFLFRSQGNTLARLSRERTAEQVTLLRTDLSPDELQNFAARMKSLLAGLRTAIQNKTAVRLRFVTDMPEFDTVLTQQIDVVLGHEGDFLSTAINHRK